MTLTCHCEHTAGMRGNPFSLYTERSRPFPTVKWWVLSKYRWAHLCVRPFLVEQGLPLIRLFRLRRKIHLPRPEGFFTRTPQCTDKKRTPPKGEVLKMFFVTINVWRTEKNFWILYFYSYLEPFFGFIKPFSSITANHLVFVFYGYLLPV